MRMHGLWAASLMALATMAAAQTAEPVKLTNADLTAAVQQAVTAKDAAGALAASEQLEASEVRDGFWAANTRQLAVLTWRAGKRAEAAAYLSAAAAALEQETLGLETNVADARRDGIVRACLDLERLEADPAARAALARTALAVSPASTPAFRVLYRSLVAEGKNDDALAACLDYSGKACTADYARGTRLRLLVSLGRTADARTEALEYLRVATDVAGATAALEHVLPSDAAALCCGLSAQQVLDGRKLALREPEGKLNSQVLLELAEQLTQGGVSRPLVVSSEALALADTLKDAPLAEFLCPLLRGEYNAAFTVAYARAKAAQVDADYVAWINAAAGALRCREQCYNGAALEFIRFINGTIPTDPVSLERP